MNPKSIHLNPSEWHVMEFLWAHGPATGRQATDHLTEKLGWSRSTTLTLLRRLEGKGAVASDAETGLKTFRPLVGREEAVGGFPGPCLPGQPQPHGQCPDEKASPAPGGD